MNELRCTITAFFIFIFSIPWYWDGFENLDFYGSCKTEYCTDRQGDIDGMPDWAWRVLMHSFIGIAFMMVAFYQWESPYMVASVEYVWPADTVAAGEALPAAGEIQPSTPLSGKTILPPLNATIAPMAESETNKNKIESKVVENNAEL